MSVLEEMQTQSGPAQSRVRPGIYFADRDDAGLGEIRKWDVMPIPVLVSDCDCIHPEFSRPSFPDQPELYGIPNETNPVCVGDVDAKVVRSIPTDRSRTQKQGLHLHHDGRALRMCFGCGTSRRHAKDPSWERRMLRGHRHSHTGGHARTRIRPRTPATRQVGSLGLIQGIIGILAGTSTCAS